MTEHAPWCEALCDCPAADARLEQIAGVLLAAGVGPEIATRAAADVVALVDNRDIGVAVPWTAGCLLGTLLRPEGKKLTDRQVAELTSLSEGTVAAIRHDWGAQH